jgi:hypothetical protein
VFVVVDAASSSSAAVLLVSVVIVVALLFFLLHSSVKALILSGVNNAVAGIFDFLYFLVVCFFFGLYL